MIASIHQPHLFPWLPYWNKMFSSDVFVLLNNVQYRKNYYQNRCLIKSTDGKLLWLTVPVEKKSGKPIEEMQVADKGWWFKAEKTIEACYRKTPHFENLWPMIKAHMRAVRGDGLVSFTMASIMAVVEVLRWDDTRITTTDLVRVFESEPNDRLTAILEKVGADAYISGKGGREYLCVSKFEAAGIRVLWQDAQVPQYRQRGDEFVPGLSVLDAIFNVGPTETVRMIKECWKP
jgi:hypothetical protein